MDTSLETSALYRALVERGKKFNLERKRSVDSLEHWDG